MLNIISCAYLLSPCPLQWTVSSCLCPFSNWIFQTCRVVRELYISEIGILSDTWFTNFLPVCSLTFHPHNRVFWRVRVFSFGWNPAFQFFSWWIMLWCHAWELFTRHRFQRFSFMLFPESSIVLCFTLNRESLSSYFFKKCEVRLRLVFCL